MTIMLNWNARKVKNLSGAEIWLFIWARLLVGFGAGTFLARSYPEIINPIAIPVFVIGAILFVIAAKGLRRKSDG